MSLEKDCFDQVVFKRLTESCEKQIMSKVRFSHAKQMFLYYLINIWKKQLIKGNSIPPCQAGPLACVDA